MTKLLVNFTIEIVYLLWLQNSGYIYSGIIIPVNVTGKYIVVKVVSRYAIGSATVCTIWGRFVFRYTCNPRHFDSRRAAPQELKSQGFC